MLELNIRLLHHYQLLHTGMLITWAVSQILKGIRMMSNDASLSVSKMQYCLCTDLCWEYTNMTEEGGHKDTVLQGYSYWWEHSEHSAPYCCWCYLSEMKNTLVALLPLKINGDWLNSVPTEMTLTPTGSVPLLPSSYLGNRCKYYRQKWVAWGRWIGNRSLFWKSPCSVLSFSILLACSWTTPELNRK